MDPPSKPTDAANTDMNFAMAGQEHHRNVIGELPIELLITIFGWASGLCGRYHMDTRSSEPYVPRLQIMAQVCQTWRDIINGTPALWTFITDQDNANAYIALDRSQSQPIGLSFGNKSATVKKKVLQMLMLEEIDVPMLQHFVLRNLSRSRHTYVLDLFRDHPPQLTSLALDRVAMRRWDTSVFSPHLRKLKLQHILTSGPTHENLHSILCACPELAHLELKMVKFSNETNGLLLQCPPAQLPLLHISVL
ncbi:hypothetical protein FRB94_003402 [Tulasnella sp. JGI-2019a]|nr:hypothetical protein FRB94_003402 [Tulasnella sp. JGI-2019a]KAG9002401.1 hypothetical protein FRB93_011518 [Tulasnella sp. JGI-2019a]